MEDDDFKHYSPRSIFHDKDNDPREMAGSNNFHLAESFYHSRYTNMHELRINKFSSNAGAVQLYRQDGKTLYEIPGQTEHKEYNCLSDPVFEGTGIQKTAYGHSERILMKMVLDDLISAHGDGEELKRPSDYSVTNNDTRNYEILKNLTEEAYIYRLYLERKGIIVKMWSERPSCTGECPEGYQPTLPPCRTFMQSICPAGSKFGYIVEDYDPYKDNDIGATKVRKTFEDYKTAYLKHIAYLTSKSSKKREILLTGDCYITGFRCLDDSLGQNTKVSTFSRPGAPFEHVIQGLLQITKHLSENDIVIIVVGAKNIQPDSECQYMPDISMIENLAAKITVIVVGVPLSWYNYDETERELPSQWYLNRAVEKKLSNIANVHVFPLRGLTYHDYTNYNHGNPLSYSGKEKLAQHLISLIYTINRIEHI